MANYKEIDGVRYQVVNNTFLGSNLIPVGETLPDVSVSDNGKLLGVDSSGEWVPVDAPSGLPDITGNAGKVLKVNAGATGTEWANETTELPAVTIADEGDVLAVNSSGQWAKTAPSGGLPVVTEEDVGKYLRVIASAAPPYVEMIPSQTVTLVEAPAELSPAVSPLENGTPVVFTVNDVDYETFSQYSDIEYDAGNISYYFIYDANDGIYKFVADSGGNIVTGTYTVSLKTGTLSYAWGVQSGSPT